MKREDQKRNKELQKNLNLLLKECPKAYKAQKLKKIDHLLWTTRNGMIYEFFPSVCIRETDLKPILTVRVNYKPLWVDDLLWDILGMESNKKEPDSLKVIGAFTARCASYGQYVVELPAEDIESLKMTLFEEIDKFLHTIDVLVEDRYMDEILASDRVSDIDKALIYIHQGKMIEAKALVSSSKDDGRFVIGEKSYKELVMKYLEL